MIIKPNIINQKTEFINYKTPDLNHIVYIDNLKAENINNNWIKNNEKEISLLLIG